MAFQDSDWPCVGELSMMSISTKEKQYTWDLAEFLNIYYDEAKEVKSDNFTLAGATWNFFTAFNDWGHAGQYQFGINVRTSNAQFDSICSISFLIEGDHAVKKFKFNLTCKKADTHCVANNLLNPGERKDFTKNGKKIICRISIKKSSNKGTCSLNVDEDILKNHPVYKVCQDLKQLFESGVDSDVTFQVGDQQFKAHRSILKARSSVFAAMFHHEMKEKATGVVNVEDCEPSSFSVLLKFLYSGSTEKLSVENMFSVYKSADKYNVQDLKMQCIEFIKNDMEENELPNVNVEDGKPSSFSVFLEFLICGSTEKLSYENVVTLFKYGDKYNLEDLKTKCVEFMKKNLSVENFKKFLSCC